MVHLYIFILGLCFGSFASVIIHRLHTKEKGMLWGRSKCPRCSKTLGVADLIPVISFFTRKFKCHYCKKPISFMYPVLELMMAGSFLITTLVVGTQNIASLVFFLFITFVFILLSFYDYLFQEISDEVVLPALVIAFLYMWLTDVHSLGSLGLGILVPVLFFGILFFGSSGRWLGGGDIRIGALMGALLGWPYILIGLFLGYFTGAIFSSVGLLTKTFNRKSQIPFAPFLLLGTYIALFWGKDIFYWYIFYL